MLSADPVSVIGEILIDVRDEISLDNDDASNWIIEILTDSGRAKKDYCEICERRVISEDLEIHHVASRSYGKWTITACKKCHGDLTNKQKSLDWKWNKQFGEGNSEYYLFRGLIDVCELKFYEIRIQFYRNFAYKLRDKLVNFNG